MKVSITFYVQFANEGNRTADYEALRENRSHTRPSRSVSIFFSSSPSLPPLPPPEVRSPGIIRGALSPIRFIARMGLPCLRISACDLSDDKSGFAFVHRVRRFLVFFLRPHKRYVCIVARRATIAAFAAILRERRIRFKRMYD